MYNPFDIYTKYKKANAKSKNKEFTQPKSFGNLSEEGKNNFQKLADFFNTKWSDINIDKYMDIGFDLFKTFNHRMFFNDKIIETYIIRDKIKKSFGNVKKEIEADKKYVRKNHINVVNYCDKMINNRRKPIDDYLNNKISSSFLVYLIKFNYIKLTTFEKSLCSQMLNQHKQIEKEI